MNDRSVMLRRAVIGALVLASAPALGQQTTQTDENTRTVETIKYEMMRGLNLHSTTQLVRYAIEHRLVPF